MLMFFCCLAADDWLFCFAEGAQCFVVQNTIKVHQWYLVQGSDTTMMLVALLFVHKRTLFNFCFAN
ncbi:MAG: hypothetical protein JWP81_1706 [Ferruginibacter sp.]|nr:hypothetical protein [Ferruginibacter sp.]